MFTRGKTLFPYLCAVIRNTIDMKKSILTLTVAAIACLPALAQQTAAGNKDTLTVSRHYDIEQVVVTGTRNATDIRHLPLTVSVVGRQQIEQLIGSMYL